jgi:hypothetical protein
MKNRRMLDLADIACDIFLQWLNGHQESVYSLTQLESRRFIRGGDVQYEIAVRPIFDVDSDETWSHRLQNAASEVQRLIGTPVAIWIPPETDLPQANQSEFVQRIADAAAAIEPGQRGQVEFPVKLTLQKTSAEASYVQVSGGLAPLWARLTGRAYGQYLLDTTAIHRLPEPESRVADLLEWVALLGNGMKPGSTSEIAAEDAWTLYRPTQAAGCEFIGATPETDPTNGTRVRVLLRNALRSTAQRERVPDSRNVLLLVGIFRNIHEETATIALRSCDPDMYAAFDYICLVADGACKPLFERR